MNRIAPQAINSGLRFVTISHPPAAMTAISATNTIGQVSRRFCFGRKAEVLLAKLDGAGLAGVGPVEGLPANRERIGVNALAAVDRARLAVHAQDADQTLVH